MQYRKKAIVIEAVQYTGANVQEIIDFTNGQAFKYGGKSDYMTIPTLEGDHIATTGDFIIKGIKGEFYPCKPDIFEGSYDIVGGDIKKNKSLGDITKDECLEAANILGSVGYLSPESQVFQVKELLEGIHNKQTNIPGIGWYRVFRYLEGMGYEIC